MTSNSALLTGNPYCDTVIICVSIIAVVVFFNFCFRKYVTCVGLSVKARLDKIYSQSLCKAWEIVVWKPYGSPVRTQQEADN